MNFLLKRLGPAVLAAALLGAATTAQAAEPSFFETFQTLCLNHVYDADGIKAEAQAQGFEPDGQYPSNGRQMDAYSKVAAAGKRIVGVNASVRDEVGSIPQSYAISCALYGGEANDNLVEQMDKWLGIEDNPDLAQPGEAFYFFTEIDGVRTPIREADGDAALSDGLRRGRVWMVQITQAKDESAISISVFQATSQKKKGDR